MTDEPETPLTAAEEEEVRRLLADARHDEPMPTDVAARMDRVLDDLAAEPSRRAPVTELATRRRRVATMLVAAAAVVVVGIGLGQVVGAGSSGEDDAGADSATSAEAPAAADSDAELSEGGGRTTAGEDGTAANGAQEYVPGGNPVVEGKVFELSSQSLSRDLHKVQNYVLAPDARLDENWSEASLGKCLTPRLGDGTVVRVRYARRDGVVVLRTPAGDTQVADVYLCGEAEPVRSLTLRIP